MIGNDRKLLSKTRLVKSALALVVCYLVAMLFIFLIILISHRDDFGSYFSTRLSQLITLCLCSLLLYCIVFYYFYYSDREFLSKASNVFLVFTVLTVCIIISYVFGKFVNIYLRPVSLLAMMSVFLFNRRQSVVLNFVFAVLLFVIDMYAEEVITFDPSNGKLFSFIISFVCGTFAVFVSGNVRTRGGLLVSGVIVALPTILVVMLLKLPNIADPDVGGWVRMLAAMGFSVLGCLISAVLALALLPVFEFSFNKLTIFRLRELTSTNAPILVRLRKEAPGTFNHSLIVAQLTETCAIAIGENSELARAAAYYHDVGKLKQPDCFTENQTDYNVHDELMPELSADIIRSHAKDGYELLKSARFPEIIADVALQHHGTMPIKYFYDKALKISGDADIKDYSYLGPVPQTKIAVIVMIADAAEASVRALQSSTAENVERVVRGIIEERMDLDQFGECNITMRELTIIKQMIVEALSGVHHHRVEYPAIRFNREKKAVKEDDKGKDAK